MTIGASPAQPAARGAGVPLIRPLTTGATASPPTRAPSTFSRVPPLRIGVGTPRPVGAGDLGTVTSSSGSSFVADDENADWRDESSTWQIGEAEPEDELPLVHANRIFPPPASDRDGLLPAAARSWPAPTRVEEIASQLEGIARTLRRHGSPTPLLGPGQGRDPLTALVAGYLIGYFEGSGSREPGSSG